VKLHQLIASFLAVVLSFGIVFSIAHASLTFTSSSITGDSSFTNLTGAATTTIDVGAFALNLQTTNNGAVKFGTGAINFSGLTASQLLGTDANKNGTSVAVGTGLSLSGGTLSASSTLASSTLNLTINNPTTTAPSYTMASWDFQRTFQKIECYDAVGTTTLEIYNTTSLATTAKNAYIVASLTCGASGGSTTSFTSSTLLPGYALLVNVTSTAGTPTQARVRFITTKQ